MLKGDAHILQGVIHSTGCCTYYTRQYRYIQSDTHNIQGDRHIIQGGRHIIQDDAHISFGIVGVHNWLKIFCACTEATVHAL